MAASSYRADISKDFDVARQRAAQSENRQMQAQRDALTRRQAQMGGGPGGAFVKAEQQAQGESAQRLAQANEGIDTAQRQEQRRFGEIDEARAYQTSERLGSQKFAAGERAAGQKFSAEQAESQRKWATGERMSSQDFANVQAEAQRKWATGERMSSQDWQALESGKQRDWQTGERMSSQDWQSAEAATGRAWQQDQNKEQRSIMKTQFAEQMAMAWAQFGHEKDVDAFNMDMATKMFNKKDMLESLFSGERFNNSPLGQGAGRGQSWWDSTGLGSNSPSWGGAPSYGGGGSTGWGF